MKLIGLNLTPDPLGKGHSKQQRSPSQAKVPKRLDCEVRFGSLVDILTSPRHVRFTSESGHSGHRTACPVSAISGPRRRIRYLADVTMPHRDRAPNIDHYALAVSQRIASMMTWVERSTSCQTTLRSIPSCVPSSGKMNNNIIRIREPQEHVDHQRASCNL